MGNSGSLANAYYNVKNTKNKNTQKQSNSNPNHSGPTTRSKKKKANIADMYVVTNDGIDVFFNGQFMIKGRHLMYEEEIVQIPDIKQQELMDWTVLEVCAWIVNIDDGKYYKYVHYFGQNQVDGDDLYSFNLNDLINCTNYEMDIKDCRKLLSHIDALKAIKSKNMTRAQTKQLTATKSNPPVPAPIHTPKPKSKRGRKPGSKNKKKKSKKKKKHYKQSAKSTGLWIIGAKHKSEIKQEQQKQKQSNQQDKRKKDKEDKDDEKQREVEDLRNQLSQCQHIIQTQMHVNDQLVQKVASAVRSRDQQNMLMLHQMDHKHNINIVYHHNLYQKTLDLQENLQKH